eukprot:1344779-Pleurochrysis_carterae.AAC.1
MSRGACACGGACSHARSSDSDAPRWWRDARIVTRRPLSSSNGGHVSLTLPSRSIRAVSTTSPQSDSPSKSWMKWTGCGGCGGHSAAAGNAARSRQDERAVCDLGNGERRAERVERIGNAVVDDDFAIGQEPLAVRASDVSGVCRPIFAKRNRLVCHLIRRERGPCAIGRARHGLAGCPRGDNGDGAHARALRHALLKSGGGSAHQPGQAESALALLLPPPPLREPLLLAELALGAAVTVAAVAGDAAFAGVALQRASDHERSQPSGSYSRLGSAMACASIIDSSWASGAWPFSGKSTWARLRCSEAAERVRARPMRSSVRATDSRYRETRSSVPK